MLTQKNGKLETCNFSGPLLKKKKADIEQLFQNNHRNGSRTKDFSKNTDKSNKNTPQTTIYCNKPKVNSVLFEDTYDHINPMENTYDDTHLMEKM